MSENFKSCLSNMDFNNLPEDLSSEELIECLLLASKGNMAAREKIIIHNIKLVRLVLTKFYDSKITKEEMFSAGILGLIKAVDTFKLDMKISFPTYATVCVKNEILTLLRSKTKSRKDVSLDDVINYSENRNHLKYKDILFDEKEEVLESLIYEADKVTLRKSLEKLNNKEREVIYLLFGFYNNKCFTQKEIAERLKLTQSMISRIKKKAILAIKIEFSKIENNLETYKNSLSK